jgi:hypothetical protein
MRSDAEKTALVTFMGQIVSGHVGQGVAEYFVPKKALQHPDFAGTTEIWEKACFAGVIEERSKGYIVPQKMIYTLEEATGKTIAEAQALYQQARSTSSDITR